MEEGEVERKRVEKEEDGMAVCRKQRTVTRARGVRDVEYVWRVWRSLYTPPGSLWGHSGFWYVISEIPVYLCVACCPCAMFQLERAKRALVRCESGITCAGRAERRVGSPTLRRIKLFRALKISCGRARQKPVARVFGPRNEYLSVKGTYSTLCYS